MEKNVNCVSTTPEQMYAELMSERKARLDSPEIMQIPTFQPKNSIRISEEIILAKDKIRTLHQRSSTQSFCVTEYAYAKDYFCFSKTGTPLR